MGSISRRLEALVREANARCALLLDYSGQIIGLSGDFDRREVVSLGALLAGNFASAREIARLLREPSFKMSFQQGEKDHVLTSMVSSRCLLSVLFSVSGQLGLVKVLSARAAEDLSAIIDWGQAQAKDNGLDARTFRIAAEKGIERWFRDRSEAESD